jgi:beta-galactosidase
MMRQPQSAAWDTKRHVKENYYIPVKSFGAPVEFVDETGDFTRYPVLIAPAYQLLDKELVDKWKAYVEQGGHLVLSCRTGQKDRNGHLWEAKWAAPIYDLIGAELFGYDIIPSPAKGFVGYGRKQYEWSNWGDILEPREGTESWAEYRNGFYKGKSAVTHRKLGKGTVTYIGVDTDSAELEKTVLRQIYEQAGIATEDLPAGLTMEYRDGFGIAVNYSDQVYSVPAPEGAQFIFGGAEIGSCEVAVWK